MIYSYIEVIICHKKMDEAKKAGRNDLESDRLKIFQSLKLNKNHVLK